MHDDFLETLAKQAQGNRSHNSVVGTLNEAAQLTHPKWIIEAASRLKNMLSYQHGFDAQAVASLETALNGFLATANSDQAEPESAWQNKWFSSPGQPSVSPTSPPTRYKATPRAIAKGLPV